MIRADRQNSWKEYNGNDDPRYLSREEEFNLASKRDLLLGEKKRLELELKDSNGNGEKILGRIGEISSEFTVLRNIFAKSYLNLVLNVGFKYYRRNPNLDQDEIVSKTQEKLFDCFYSWNPEVGRATTYLRRAVILSLYNMKKQKINRKMISFDLLDDEEKPKIRSGIIEKLEEEELKGRIDEGLNRLDDREKAVLEMRIGLKGSEVHTLEEVGAYLGFCKERIRQIQNEALIKLRLYFNKNLLE